MGWTKQRSPTEWRTKIRYCSGKPSYDKKTAITAKNRRYKQDRIWLRIYQCPYCNLWHLTSQPKHED